MGKKGKVGKSRRDKFYRLAKETGFRSRSSFKLIQLNRKFQFLPKSRALLDLCAAPGGWECEGDCPGREGVPGSPLALAPQAVRKELQTWKVDVVLNDGAPNVGASWVHDAYSQANLTLMALKLACEFLSKGGWFITKVFRSRDYQPLLWIFQQFFRKVQATKPQASRNESAEIFVVCQGYLSPDKIDSKFFDPKFAFKEVEIQAKSVSELVTKKKPKAEGYAEGDTTLYHCFTLMDFLKAPNPVDFLSKANEITLGDSELERHSTTTEELRQCCRDIRVLGRKELRYGGGGTRPGLGESGIAWITLGDSELERHSTTTEELRQCCRDIRVLGRKELSLSSGEEEEEGGEEEVGKTSGAAGDGAAEEEEMELRLAELKAEEVAELKRKKKKILKEQRKQRERIELKMDLPGVSIADEGETGMFSLRTIGKTRLLNEVARGDMASADAFLEAPHEEDDVALSEQDDADDVSLASDLGSDELADVEERLQEAKRGLGPKRGTFQQLAEEEGEENPLLVPLEEKSVLDERQTTLWFGKKKLPPPQDGAAALSMTSSNAPPSNELPWGPPVRLTHWPCLSHPGNVKAKGQKKLPPPQDGAAAEVGSRAAVGAGPSEAQGGGSSGEDDSDSNSDEERETSQKGRKRALVEPGGFEVVPIEDPVKRARVLDAEGLALGSVIATSRKAKRDLIDNSFNRVAEAKARKRRRMLKKMEQMKKKAEAVVSTVDISEREKVAQLRSIYKKAGLGKEKREVTYLVAKRGVGRRVRRPAGVKGHFKVVDSRMKKDMRAQKGKEKTKRRRK
ncbi:Putative rRNA methyltransferase 3 [Chelonia mydas]|uniref:Putative rRNA methyltransferase 3 n=1 Tax=Chelonia mydas TaxID=8469 RepID=M7ANF7_CHEMY|nr:Putative rRNA methyltransferase 3 [Chelonia mydas]